MFVRRYYQKFITINFIMAANQNSSIATQSLKFMKQKYDYFLVLDFEATCDDKKKLVPQEIIEFPVLKISASSFKIEDQFHRYVQPKLNKILTPFCTDLTGITQSMVDNQSVLEETLDLLDKWIKKNNDLVFNEESQNFIFVTCGDWDLRTMLPTQCSYFNINYPPYLRSWINLKKSFAEMTAHFPKSMMTMLHELGIEHSGKHHSGIDDCNNIAKIVAELGRRGYVFTQTGRL